MALAITTQILSLKNSGTRWEATIAKHSTKKERYTDRYVQIKGWEMRSAAFLALKPNEVRVYLEMRSRYNGNNNGRISFSSREAGDICHKSFSTGSRALKRLAELEFIKIRAGSEFGFNQKRLSREYELTAIALKASVHNDRLPLGTKDFMRWTAEAIHKMDLKKTPPQKQRKKTKHSCMSERHSSTGANASANIVNLRP